MTLIEIVIFLLLIGCGIAGAKVLVWATSVQGWWTYPIWIVGFIGAIAAVIGGVNLIIRIMSVLRPEFPMCEKGNCRPWKFTLDDLKHSPLAPKDSPYVGLYHCECGDQYAYLGDSFMRVGSDGLWHPFRKRDGSRRWVEDTGQPLIPRVEDDPQENAPAKSEKPAG